MTNQRQALADDLREILLWEQELGNNWLPQPSAATPTPARNETISIDTRSSVQDQGDVHAKLQIVASEASVCTKCSLHRERTKSVFARGNESSDIMFVGEGPGFHEDQKGLPFVGPAGQLLDKMVSAMGYARDDVYICNVVKCRPPNNRTPTMEEASMCSPYLREQIRLVQPKIIVALGRCAVEALGCMIGRSWRGSWGEYAGVPVMSTYHPAFLLRSPEFKRVVWEDLQKVIARLKSSIEA